MKKTILLAISIFTIIHSYAIENKETINTTNQTTELLQLTDDTTVVMIRVANLPQPAKNTVGNYEYLGWIADQVAYHIIDKAKKTEYYKITMKNPNTNRKKVLKLNKDGREFK